MKKTGISFWTLYTLGFTVALPVFLYYNAEDLPNAGPVPDQSATTSFIYLGIGLLLWLAVIVLYARFYLKLVFWEKRRYRKTAREGTTLPAKILSKKTKKVMGDVEVLELKLAFTNLAGTSIEAPYELNDARPHERRFEPGSSLEMCAHQDKRHLIFIPRTARIATNIGVVSLYAFFFVLILLFAIGYLLFSYRLESQGYGWRFLKPWHPWLLVPAINLGTAMFLGALFLFIGKATGNALQPLKLALYGIRAKGILLNYRQTGLSINDQPQVEFDIQYTDRQGRIQQVAYKRIVPLLELHKLAPGEKEIIYLPDHPSEIFFYEDLTLS